MIQIPGKLPTQARVRSNILSRVGESSTSVKGLPGDHHGAILVGRVWVPAEDGPTLVAVHGDGLHDLSGVATTCSQLLELEDPAAAVRRAGSLPRIGAVQDVLANSI